MKKQLLFLFLFLTITSYCQPGDTLSRDKPAEKDSIITTTQEIKDSIAKSLQKANSDEKEINNSSDMDYFLQLQKEQRAKQKRAAIIRIAIGLGLLVVLIIGLRRRTVKK